MATILIAGCGYIGTALALRLHAAGHRVYALRRDPAGLPEGIHPVAADLGDAPSLSKLPPGLDAVYYTTGADAFDEAAYHRAYVGGLGNLIDALENQGQRPKRILFTSSTGVYHQNDDALLDEDSPTAPTRFSGRVLLDAEARLAVAPWPNVTLRLGGIYGPGRTRLLDDVRAGRARKGPGYLNLVHRDDAAGMLHHLIETPAPEPRYLGVDGTPVLRNDLIDWIAGKVGVAPLPEPPPAADFEPQRGGLRRFSNGRIKATGYHIQFPSYQEGYADLL